MSFELFIFATYVKKTMNKEKLTENKAEATPSGGVLIGKREGQTMIHSKGSLSGYLVGRTHAEGGIKAINKSTGQPLEMQGGEVVITAPAVSDTTKREFEGRMMTNREILSEINENGGGVSFAYGGNIPTEMHFSGNSYKYGGKTVSDHDIAYEISICGCEHDILGDGGKIGDMPTSIKKKVFTPDGERKITPVAISILTNYVNSLPQTKELNTDSKGNYTKERQELHKKIINEFKDELVCIQKEEPIAILMGGSPASGKSTFLRKYAPYLLEEEILKVDADEIRAMLPEYKGYNATQTHLETKDIVNTLLSDKTIGIPCKYDIIYDGTMNSTKSYLPLIALLKSLGYKIFIVYIDNVPEEVVKKRALERYKKSGRFVPMEVIDDFYGKGKVALEELKLKSDGYMIIDGSSGDYNILEKKGLRLPKKRLYSKLGEPISKLEQLVHGGHLSKGMSLKQIAKMHGVSFLKLNRQVKMGLNAESEHTPKVTEQMKIVKDHLYENPNYYTLLKEAGLEKGGSLNGISDLSQKDLQLYDRASNVRPRDVNQNNRYHSYLGLSVYTTSENRNNIFIENVDKVFHNVDDAEKYIEGNDMEESKIPFWIGTEKRYYELYPEKKGLYKKGGEVDYVTYKDKYNKKYNYDKNTSHDLDEISKDTGVSLKGLQQIYNKGIGAYKTNPSSVRPNVKSKEQWAMARVYSAVMGGKASEVDSNELKMNYGGRFRKDNLVKDAENGNTPARDFNNYNDVMDIHADGAVGGDSGIFANGGALGTSGLPLVDYIEITSSGSSLVNIVGVQADNFESFKNIVFGEYKLTQKPRSFVNIQAYDSEGNKLTSASSEISDQKNTVKNFNPYTGKPSDLAKSFAKSRPINFKKYDWSEWFSGKKSMPSKQASATSNLVTGIYISYTNPTNNSLSSFTVDNASEFLYTLLNLYRNSITKIDYRIIVNGNILEETISDLKLNDDVTDNWRLNSNTINPKVATLDDVAYRLEKENSFFDFTNFMKSGGLNAIGQPTNTSTVLSEVQKNISRDNKITEIVLYNSVSKRNSTYSNLRSLYMEIRDIASLVNGATLDDFISFNFINGDGYKISETRSIFHGNSYDALFVNDVITQNEFFRAIFKNFPELEFRKTLTEDSEREVYEDFKKTAQSTISTGANTATSTSGLIEIPDSKNNFDGKVLSLPSPILELLSVRIREQNLGNISKIFDMPIEEIKDDNKKIFSFENSVDGFSFWSNISQGDFTEFKQKYGKYGEKVKDIITTAQPIASSKFTSAEIKLFEAIDDIVLENSLKNVEIPIFEWNSTGAKDYDLVNEDTGEVFKLRSFGAVLGLQNGDINLTKSLALLKDYLDWKKGGSSTATTSVSKTLSKEDLEDIKIKINSDFDLALKIVQKLEQVGFTNTSGIKRKIENKEQFHSIWRGTGNYVGWFIDEDNFNDSDKKEIFPSDIGIGSSTATAQPSSSKYPTINYPTQLEQTKIWIGDNPELSKRVQERAMELGWDWWSGDKKPQNLDFSCLFFDVGQKITGSETRVGFDSFQDYKEIFESDLFGSVTTATQNQPTAPLTEEQKIASEFVADDSVLRRNDILGSASLRQERNDLDALAKLLPSFQQSKFSVEKASILKEMARIQKKLDYKGFIASNEEVSKGKDLFTPQGLLNYYFTQATQNPTAELQPPCELPTPNGGKSKLPLVAYLNVRSTQFKKWFGDWEKAYETDNYVNCSKMIDEETKEPKIFYHGVRKYIPSFGQMSNMGVGVVRPYGSFEPPNFPASYFADNESYANFYGGIAENMPKPSEGYKPFIYKVFLCIKNPISLLPLDFEISYKDLIDYVLVAYGIRLNVNSVLLKQLGEDMDKKHPIWIYVRRDIGLIETLKDYGYDALIQQGDIPVFDKNGEVVSDRSKFIKDTEYLSFYPNQVKSATVKKSFYFNFFNDIRFKKGGYVRI